MVGGLGLREHRRPWLELGGEGQFPAVAAAGKGDIDLARRRAVAGLGGDDAGDANSVVGVLGGLDGLSHSTGGLRAGRAVLFKDGGGDAAGLQVRPSYTAQAVGPRWQARWSLARGWANSARMARSEPRRPPTSWW